MANPLVSQAGKFDRRVAIVRLGAVVLGNQWSGSEVAGGKDSYGATVPAEPGEIARWCSVKPAPGYERFLSGEIAATALWRFIFRWETDLVRVTDALRTDDGRMWDIKSADPIGRREGWDVLASARMESL